MLYVREIILAELSHDHFPSRITILFREILHSLYVCIVGMLCDMCLGSSTWLVMLVWHFERILKLCVRLVISNGSVSLVLTYWRVLACWRVNAALLRILTTARGSSIFSSISVYQPLSRNTLDMTAYVNQLTDDMHFHKLLPSTLTSESKCLPRPFISHLQMVSSILTNPLNSAPDLCCGERHWILC